jgi:beta-lactamase class A
MSTRGPNLLRWVSIGMLLAAVVLFFVELVLYSRQRAAMPEGLSVAGVPVGGLDQPAALERLAQTYSTPVELFYGDQLILLNPSQIGYRLDTEAMMAAAELDRTGPGFWSGFWDYLWNRPGEPTNIPVRSEYSESELETFLKDVGARYDQPPLPPRPVPGTTQFEPGTSGKVLDVARASELIGEALNQPSARQVTLPVVDSQPGRPNLATLGTLLKQILQVQEFNGLADIYVMDLRSGEDLHVLNLNGQDLPGDPDVAITAGSTIKVPIAISYYRYFDTPLSSEAQGWLKDMLTLSGNDSADSLMEQMDRFQGPLKVTDTMQALGLDSTFIAGYFHLGAELLKRYQTPGNTRSDINTQPDPYNQTTATQMGVLMADLYRCSKGGGALLAAFPGELSSDECQAILDLMVQNKIGVLIEAGVPDGTEVAHKHGWTDSPLQWLGDAGIVYTSAGDYVIAVYLWDQQEMIWNPASELVADLSRATYNFFNSPTAAGSTAQR